MPEHKRVIALCSKVVTKMLRAHIEERFNEEVIIKGGHVNIRSQVKIPNSKRHYQNSDNDNGG